MLSATECRHYRPRFRVWRPASENLDAQALIPPFRLMNLASPSRSFLTSTAYRKARDHLLTVLSWTLAELAITAANGSPFLPAPVFCNARARFARLLAHPSRVHFRTTANTASR